MGSRMAIIREAELEDLQEIVRLHGEASDLQGRLDPRLAASPAEARRFPELLRSMIGARGSPVVVAEGRVGDGLGGYAMATMIDNSPFRVSEFAYVACLYVRQRYLGGGLGAALWSFLRDRLAAEGSGVAQTDVSVRDPKARRFWADRGFESFLDHLSIERQPALPPTGSSPWEIREAEAGDRGAVLELWEEMMGIHSDLDDRLSVGPSWEREITDLYRRWRTEPRRRVIVADGPTGVIGFAVGSVAEVVLGLKPSTYGHIAHLCVAAEFRRRGVGRQLFSSLRDWFKVRGVDSIHLYASPLNPVSQQFWRSLGFVDYVERLWCDLS
jgi:GNAT superfamily N-acetyltransferase